MTGFASRIIPALFVATGAALLASPAWGAGSSLLVSGDLMGSIVDNRGIPQMGATVQLFDRLDHLVSRTTSAADGHFAFPHLPADTYSVRVSLTDFLSATRDRILVRPGLDSILQIHLATLLSNVELSYTVPSAPMTKDWRNVLRTSPATRPITRFRSESAASAEPFPHVFSDTHAVVSVAGGDFNVIDSDLRQGDMGTGFALSTNLLEKNQIRLGGSVVQNSAFTPAAIGIRAVYTRKDDDFGSSSSPEVTLTMSQISVGPGSGLNSLNAGLGTTTSPLRTIAVGVYQGMDLGGSLRVEYGASGQAVEAWAHRTRFSPFARITASLGSAGEIVAAYSDGGRPDALLAHQEDAAATDVLPPDDLSSVTDSLSHLPQVSYAEGRLQLQRTRTYEIGYQKHTGTRTYGLSAFTDDVANGRLDVTGNTSLLDSGNLMSDGISPTSVYNIGDFRRSGVLASVDQHLNDSIDFTVAYGRIGGLSTTGTESWTSSGSITNFLSERSHNTATITFNGKAPKLGTKFTAGYGWMDSNAIIPRHVFTTQNAYVMPGLNVVVRQPLPTLFGMPGRLEISADLRNLLSQGYLPLDAGSGRSMLLVQSPRAIRGGLNFIF